MKKTQKLILTLFSLTALSFTYTFGDSSSIQKITPPNSGGPAAMGNGDRTGSPLSSGNCASCHSGGSFSPTVNIFITDPLGNQVTSYVPGQDYIIEYFILFQTGSPVAYGMQSVILSPSAGNPEAGTFNSTVTPGGQISSSGGYSYYEHSTPSSTGIFQVNWTAPPAGTGDVNIYASGIAMNGNGSTSGDESTPPFVHTFPEACAPTTGTDVRTECDSLMWIDGNTYTASNNSATFVLTNAGGCDSTVTLDLTINSVNNAVSTSGVTLTADASGAIYQWIDCGNGNTAISGETGQSFTATANGDYAVIVTESGCTDTSACTAISQVGIVENSFGTSLVISPNPTQGQFSIDFGNNYEEITISVRDLNGKELQAEVLKNIQMTDMQIDQPSGVYLLMITAEDKKAVIRMVKN